MIKDKINEIKNGLIPKKDDNKKKIENLVFFLIILIITIFVINIVLKDENPKKEETNYKVLADQEEIQDEVNNSKDELKQNLENILAKISGVGKVSVLITYSESSEVIPMYNENITNSSTEESDDSGRNKNNNSNRYK